MNIAATVPKAKDSALAWHREILDDLKSVIVGELAQHGEWIVANVLTNSFWPIAAQKGGGAGSTFGSCRSQKAPTRLWR
jgi:hypothetical protein